MKKSTNSIGSIIFAILAIIIGNGIIEYFEIESTYDIWVRCGSDILCLMGID